GEVTIKGTGEVDPAYVVEQLEIKKGQRFSQKAIRLTEIAVADMKLFGSIDISPQYDKARKKTEVPVLIRLAPVKLRGIKAGVGSLIGSRVDAHGLVGYDDRYFLFGRRRFSADLRGGLVFYPVRVESLTSQPLTEVLEEIELDLAFEQSAFLERKTTLEIEAVGRRHYPDLFSIPDEPRDDDNVVGYWELDTLIGPRRRFTFSESLSLIAEQYLRVQYDVPFSYNFDEVPDGFRELLIPYLETRLKTFLPFEDDIKRQVDSLVNRGISLGLRFEAAPIPATNTIDSALFIPQDIKIRPDLRLYIPISKDVALAGRWTTGFLFAFNYGSTLSTSVAPEPTGAPGEAPPQPADVSVADQQLLFARGFLSGGPSSNRGYGFNEIGPHRLLQFRANNRRLTNPDIDVLEPLGGIGMWEVSGELRFRLPASLVGVVFVDASDVVEGLGAFRLDHPHLSPGLGLRLASPVGSLRFDLGFRPAYLQRIGEFNLDIDEGGDPTNDNPLPVNVNLAIGEAI
ncbi:MAG: BamA/TamA family outer membrane protein, partial [Myxococcota bacterium]